MSETVSEVDFSADVKYTDHNSVRRAPVEHLCLRRHPWHAYHPTGHHNREADHDYQAAGHNHRHSHADTRTDRGERVMQ